MLFSRFSQTFIPIGPFIKASAIIYSRQMQQPFLSPNSSCIIFKKLYGIFHFHMLNCLHFLLLLNRILILFGCCQQVRFIFRLQIIPLYILAAFSFMLAKMFPCFTVTLLFIIKKPYLASKSSNSQYIFVFVPFYFCFQYFIVNCFVNFL